MRCEERWRRTPTGETSPRLQPHVLLTTSTALQRVGATHDEPDSDTVAIFENLGKEPRRQISTCARSPSWLRLSWRPSPPLESMLECTRKIQSGREISVANGRLHEPTSGGRDSRARRDVGTLRLNGRGLAPICESFFSDLWPLSCAAV